MFSEAGRQTRETLRIELHQSAVNLRRDRLSVESGESMVAKFTLQDRVRELGFGDDTAQLVDLLPLVHVAWADGSVHARERARILSVLDVRGVPKGRPYEVMSALLEKKPSEEYLEESLAVLRELVGKKPSQQKSVVQLCLEVARATGGFLGMRRISKREKEMINRIADALGAAAKAEFKARMV